jgi:hypothetical protein
MTVIPLLVVAPWAAAILALKGIRQNVLHTGEALPSQASRCRAFGAR